MASDSAIPYFERRHTVKMPTRAQTLLSRICFPVLAVLSREQSLKLRLVPVDDERVIMALKFARGRVLDVGCGSNTFVRSYGNGVGVDVVEWEGCDQVIEDAASLPFEDGSFDTVSFLACLNHIANRDLAVREAYRVLKPGGRVLLTMIPPRVGAFTHWLRERNDPDHRERSIDHSSELMGMSARDIRSILLAAGFRDPIRRRFVFGLNSIFVARRPTG